MLTRLYKENLLLQQRLFGTRRIFRSIPSAPPWYSTVEHVTQATPLLAKQMLREANRWMDIEVLGDGTDTGPKV